MNRYYVIINGINSLTIPGLAIKELPPITKTLMRNQREEIDGRDGDITTELGYSAYDKTMTIGLYGNYDINQIIAFFNQKGTIVFSDEADKYYNFTILERIDYAKLVKFRTANVKFHCQPFKYKLNETPQTITTELVESTGEEATLNDTAETSLQIGLKGNTYQYSTTGQQLYDVFDTLVFGDIVSLDDDGWITISYDNTSGSSTKFSDFKTKTSNKVQTGQTYKLVLEIKSVTGSGNLNFAMNQPISQTGTSVTYNLNTLSVGTSVHDITMKSDFTGCTSLLNSYCSFPAGQSGSITFRMSVLADLSVTPQTFTYEPFTGGIPAPNPDYPQGVQVVTGENIVKIQSKNWVNGKQASSVDIPDGINMVKNADGSYTLNGTITSTKFMTIIDQYDLNIPVGDYILSIKDNDGNGYRGDTYYYYGGASNYKYKDYANQTYTFEEEVNRFRVVLYLAAGTYNNTKIYIQLEHGSVETNYEAYQNQNYTIDLDTIELCKIGTYQDYLYKSGENWYKHKEIGKVILDGTIGGYNSGNNWFYIGLSNLGITSANALVCNYFKFYEDFTSLVNTTIGIGLSNNLTNFLIRNTALTSENDYKTWLGNNNTIVYYALATPTEEQITDEALITQLELLQNAMSYLDQTNVTQAYDNMPFILVLNAIKKGTNEITINNIGNIYSKPIMALNGSGMIKININDTEVLRVDMSEHHNIVIDSANMEAYNPNTMALRNRQVTGNYENLKLNQGENKIKVLGQLTEATITDYTRWL